MALPASVQPFVLALAAVLATAVLVGADIWRERERSTQETRTSTSNLARLLDEQLRQTLRRAELTLAAARARLGAREGGDAALGAELRALLPADGLIVALQWRAADGRVLASSDAGQSAATLIDGALPAPGGADGGLTLGRVVAGSERLPILLTGGASSPPGMLVAWLDLRPLQAVLDGVNTGSNGFVTLFGRDGFILATAPRNDALLARSWLESPLFKEHLPRAATGTVQQVVVRDGTERIYSYRASADHPVLVSVGVSLSDALADWRARAWRDALVLAVLALGLFTGAWRLSRMVQRRQQAEDAALGARLEAERALHFLRDIGDNLPQRVAYVDRELRYRFVNQAHVQRFGRPREAIIGLTREELTGAPPPPALLHRLERVLAGEAQRFQIEEPGPDAAPRVIETHLIPDRDRDGSVAGFYSTSTDITEQQRQQRRIEQALAERETLLREVYHRVKNNLQIVQSLLALQLRALPEGAARTGLAESAQRVHAMALVHEMLYQSGGLQAVALADYAQRLLRHLAEGAGAAQRGIRIEIRVETIQTQLETAIPFGLLVAELVGNSLKHGFPGGRTGTIELMLGPEQGELVLAVTDDGVGLPPAFDLEACQSMGLQLASALAGQLGGRLSAHAALPVGSTTTGAVFRSAVPRLLHRSEQSPATTPAPVQPRA